MKYLIIPQVATAYWLENDEIRFAPLSDDNTFDEADGGVVEDDLMDAEPLPEPYMSAKTFTELYAHVRQILGKPSERIYGMSYAQMLEHCGHKIEMNEYEIFSTGAPHTIEIRCVEKECEGEEPIIEIGTPQTLE